MFGYVGQNVIGINTMSLEKIYNNFGCRLQKFNATDGVDRPNKSIINFRKRQQDDFLIFLDEIRFALD